MQQISLGLPQIQSNNLEKLWTQNTCACGLSKCDARNARDAAKNINEPTEQTKGNKKCDQ